MNVEVASEIIRSYYAAYPAHGRSVDDVLTGRDARGVDVGAAPPAEPSGARRHRPQPPRGDGRSSGEIPLPSGPLARS
jgi:hypothetical protein